MIAAVLVFYGSLRFCGNRRVQQTSVDDSSSSSSTGCCRVLRSRLPQLGIDGVWLSVLFDSGVGSDLGLVLSHYVAFGVMSE